MIFDGIPLYYCPNHDNEIILELCLKPAQIMGQKINFLQMKNNIDLTSSYKASTPAHAEEAQKLPLKYENVTTNS